MKTRTTTRLLAILMAVMMVLCAIPAATVSAAANVKITKCSFSIAATAVYTGKARKPAVKVTYKDKTLVSGTDYTVSYKNNVNVGVATATVTAKKGSGFTGSKTLKFKIVPAKVKSLASDKQTTSAVHLTWAAVKVATGYRVFTYDTKTKTYTKVKNAAGTAATIKKLKAGTLYRFAVCAFAKSGSKTYFGTYSSVLKVKTKAAPAPQPTELPDSLGKVEVLKAAKNGTAVTFSWTKVDNATGYQVSTYNESTKAYTPLTTSATNSATVSSFKMEETYTVAVRAYAKVKDETVYGAYSDPIKVTVFYADKYNAMFKSGTFQAEIQTNMDGMTDPITLATKDGNLYMKTKMAISDSSKTTVQIRYIKSTNKTYMSAFGLWFDVTDALGDDNSMLDGANLFADLDFGNTDKTTISTKTVSGTKYTVETVPGSGNNATELYIKDGELKRIVTIENGKQTTVIKVNSITDKVDDKLFKKPSAALPLSMLDKMA